MELSQKSWTAEVGHDVIFLNKKVWLAEILPIERRRIQEIRTSEENEVKDVLFLLECYRQALKPFQGSSRPTQLQERNCIPELQCLQKPNLQLQAFVCFLYLPKDFPLTTAMLVTGS